MSRLTRYPETTEADIYTPNILIIFDIKINDITIEVLRMQCYNDEQTAMNLILFIWNAFKLMPIIALLSILQIKSMTTYVHR